MRMSSSSQTGGSSGLTDCRGANRVSPDAIHYCVAAERRNLFQARYGPRRKMAISSELNHPVEAVSGAIGYYGCFTVNPQPHLPTIYPRSFLLVLFCNLVGAGAQVFFKFGGNIIHHPTPSEHI